uniref:CapL n=1 Tax=Capnodium sp. TTI-000886 TaxID=3078996 RepID=A0AA96S2X2_9PEZI|nr:CapL [Capnodium sp. TTI-000886]
MASEKISSTTDVLVIGGGPAGLIAAWWMARCGISVRIIDKDPNPLLHGRADGMRSRTVEMLDSMGSGMQETVTKESFPMLSSSSWMRDANGDIQRVETLPLYEDHRQVLATPYHPQTLSQGRIEEIIQGALKDISAGTVKVERGREASALEYDASAEEDREAYPVSVTIRKVNQGESANSRYNGTMNIVSDGTAKTPTNGTNNGSKHDLEDGKEEVVRAKYLIGCDGARSWLRKELGYKTEGSNTNTVWVALDIYPITDFPDIRKPTAIQTPKGSMLLISREKGLLRIYVPFGEDGKDATRESVTLEDARALCKDAFKPYHFDFERCQWWSSYSLGQRHSDHAAHTGNRIFLCGDAVHNNSPLIGLGLNVSAQDAWNLGWKIALAFKAPQGVDRKALLSTYEAERLPVAKTLVWYDRNWTSLFNKALVEPMVIIQRYHEFRNFSDAYVLNYPDSSLVARQVSNQAVSSKLRVGESFNHTRIAMHSDGQTYWTCGRLRSDGRFHVILLAGDWSSPKQKDRIETFCDNLTKSSKGGSSLLYNRYPYCFDSHYYNYDKSSPDIGKPGSMLNFTTIHTSKEEIPLLDFPEAMRGPFHPVFGWDYSRVLVDSDRPYDRYCDGAAYDAWGVDRTKGAVVVLRPDLHVGWIGDLEDFGSMEKYFENIFGKAWAN